MADIPGKIAETYNKLKGEYPFYISLKKINGKYYLYKQFSRNDKETGKTKVTSTYLGRIVEDGAFIKKSASEEDLVENAKAIIIANGGKVIMPEKTLEISVATKETLEPGETDKKILTILSMNARASMTFISKQMGLTPAAVYNRVKQLEKIYKIKYTIELDLNKLGYHESVVFVKFLDKKPTLDEIKKATTNVQNVQFAAILNGKYDLLIYLLARSNDDLSDMVNLVRDSKYLSGYQIEWYVSYFYCNYNFVPIRDEFIDIIKDRLKEREYYLLKEFNANSRMEFTEVDKKYHLEKGRTDYAYYGLKRSGVLQRATINMQNTHVNYTGLVCISIIKAKKFIDNKKLLLSDMISKTEGPLNKYVLTGDIGISKGVALFLPVFNDGDLERTVAQLESFDLGIKIETLIITEIILGSFCFRRFDNTYSKQYDSLTKRYQMQEWLHVNYDETSASKKAKTTTDIRGVDVQENTEDDT